MFRFTAQTFEDWRLQAREMIVLDVLPQEVDWQSSQQASLFGDAFVKPVTTPSVSIPKDFIDHARAVGCHSDPGRWNLLYLLLWRLTHGEQKLLCIATDPLMHRLRGMEKAVRRDAHKMKAFVRFRLVHDDDGEHFLAWHRPDHRIVRFTAPFFARRFTTMKWGIFTPDESVRWDGDKLCYGGGIAEFDVSDTTEDLWRDYYRAIFNPARIKIKAMKREMPVRHWHTLPETKIISSLLAEASTRVEKMIAYSEGPKVSATDYVPTVTDLNTLRHASRACQGCELHEHATQTVFGVGSSHAKLMIVGEQPGDEEDKEGVPFAGPSGSLLDDALKEIGAVREDIYITNAVKHFRYIQQAQRRLHQSPLREHVHACKPWLQAEIAALKPKVILCLGNTAARALLSPNFIMKNGRGVWHKGEPSIVATYHPAAVLRASDDQRAEYLRHFIEDLRAAFRATFT